MENHYLQYIYIYEYIGKPAINGQFSIAMLGKFPVAWQPIPRQPARACLSPKVVPPNV